MYVLSVGIKKHRIHVGGALVDDLQCCCGCSIPHSVPTFHSAVANPGLIAIYVRGYDVDNNQKCC